MFFLLFAGKALESESVPIDNLENSNKGFFWL